MEALKRARITGAVGLCLLAVPFAWLAGARQAEPGLPRSWQPVRPVRPRTPSAEALWQGRRHRVQAQNAVKRQREAQLEALSPEAAEAMDTEEWRRLLAARDPGGHLRRARAAALAGLALARTPQEEYQARVWLVLIECDAGHHREELQHARRLMKLDPRNELSLLSLRHAARCNGLRVPVRQAQSRPGRWSRRPNANPPSHPQSLSSRE
jgi:hypothetical protein